MTDVAAANEVGLVRTFRRVLVGLAAAGTLGTAIELAMLRHWANRDQLIPWFALGVLVVALVLVVAVRTPGALHLARLAGAVVTLAALYGVVSHVRSNYNAGPLDFRYADKWAGMSLMSRWWAAASGGVGPSPALAPLILVQASACLWLATLRHPGQRGRGDRRPALASGGFTQRDPDGARASP